MARFVLGFGNRSFFPPKYMKEARRELPAVLRDMGHETVMMDEKDSLEIAHIAFWHYL